MSKSSSVFAKLAEPWAMCVLSGFLLFGFECWTLSRSEWLWRPPKAVGDGLQYENIAFHLWQGQGFFFDNTSEEWRQLYEATDDYEVHLNSPPRSLPATDRPPIFPMVIASIYSLFGRGETGFAVVRLFSGFCLAWAGAISTYWAVWIVRALSAGEARRQWVGGILASLLNVALFASNRTLQGYTQDFLTEPLALALLQSMAWVCLMSCQNPHEPKARMGWLICGGFVLGMLILTRSVFVTWLPGMVVILLVLSSGSRRERIQRASWVLGVAICVCLPWWGRNIIVLEHWAPLGTQGAIALLGGNNREAWDQGGEWQYSAERKLRDELRNDPDFQAAQSDAERELVVYQNAQQLVRDFLGQHWTELPRIMAQRTYTHWNPYYGKSLLWKVLILLGALGLIWNRCGSSFLRDSFILLLGLPVLSTLVAATLYTVGGRFLVPCYGLLNCLAAISIWPLLLLVSEVETSYKRNRMH